MWLERGGDSQVSGRALRERVLSHGGKQAVFEVSADVEASAGLEDGNAITTAEADEFLESLEVEQV